MRVKRPGTTVSKPLFKVLRNGAHLHNWRKYHGLSQAQAATLLHVPVKTLQGWEQGRPMPSHFANYLRLLEDELLRQRAPQPSGE